MSDAAARATQHLLAYQNPRFFCGWPANHGIWSWGDEILLSFERAAYQDRDEGHSYQPGVTSEVVFLCSLDGGEHWTLEGECAWTLTIPARPGDLEQAATPRHTPLDTRSPNFALKLFGAKYIYSHDRGRTWHGPHLLPNVTGELTSRTDYLVELDGSCLLFLSRVDPDVQAGGQNRSFCAHWSPESDVLQVRGDMADTPAADLSIMSSTVRGHAGQLISAIRRRRDELGKRGTPLACWIDLYESTDEGMTWRFINTLVDLGVSAGNPPSLIRLHDGRLCLTYGYRLKPHGLRAKLSSDDGITWSEDIVLRTDGRTWDLGYPRSVQRPDGRVVTLYYYTTAANPIQHIAATIWHPDSTA